MMAAWSVWENLVMDDVTMLKMAVGGFLQDLARDIQIESSSFRLYSAHDSTMRVLLMALGAFDNYWPPYASHSAFEVWKNNQSGEEFVVLQYDGRTVQMGGACASSSSSVYCPMGDFLSLLSSWDPKGLCTSPLAL